MGMPVVRSSLEADHLRAAHQKIWGMAMRSLERKGSGMFATRHEALGVITEEYHELIDAVHRKLEDEAYAGELLDIAVACLIELASLEKR